MLTRGRKVLWLSVLAFLLLLAGAGFAMNPYFLQVASIIAIFIIPTISMRVSLIAGQTNIGVIGFFAVGGYASAVLSMKLGLPFLVAVPVGGLVAAMVGFFLGTLIMKLGDLYFIIITWGFLELARSIAIKATPITGGPFGLVGIPPISIGSVTLHGGWQFAFILMTTAVVLLILYRLEYSRLGLTWKGIAQAPSLAEAVGVNVYLFKLVSFTISCFVAGVGGAMFAHYMGVLQPVTFTFLLATTVIIWNFFGGTKHFIGPVIGAIILLLAVEPMRELEQYEMLVYAAVIILATVFLPDGIISIRQRLSVARSRIRDLRRSS